MNSTASSPAISAADTLGVLPPFEAVDTCVCMGASITVGLGMRRVAPEAEGSAAWSA